MRKNYSIRKFLSLFILFTIINTCSKDESNALCNTFLECQKGTVWIDNALYTDEITYIRFINKYEYIIRSIQQVYTSKKRVL